MNANKNNDARLCEAKLHAFDDLAITRTMPSAGGNAGVWVCGTISGHRFEALVFADHAERTGYEIDDSRITKLWLQRMADKATAYSWDRGLDVIAIDAQAQAIVAFLAAGLAEHTFGI
jgi:hypothetical protein